MSSVPVPALTLIQPRVVRVEEPKTEKPIEIMPLNYELKQEVKMSKLEENIVVERIVEEITSEKTQFDDNFDEVKQFIH